LPKYDILVNSLGEGDLAIPGFVPIALYPS
jgi:hypothetical protein